MLENLDGVLLARLQFAFTMSMHIIFPGFTIGLAAFVATLEILWLKTGQEHFARLARFWTKIFAVAFAMGVVSGIMMSYQFGTNWSRFSVVVGNVIGPLMGYEVLTAFFLEATFLGILLFGWHRVPRWLHVTSAILVAVGTSISAFWILAANSWMHTPAGHEVRDGIAYPVDWLAIIFNPSFPYRFVHMLTACYLTTSLVVLAVGARFVLARRFGEEARTMMRMGLGMVAILAPLQLVIGDSHGLNTLQHQPAKIAAMEAHWDGAHPAALVLFAWPDAANERNVAEIAIPNVASLILTHEWRGTVKGLKDFPASARPPVAPVFFAFRVMVGIGLADDRDRPGWCVAVEARAAVRHRVVPAARRAGLAARLHRNPRRMDRDRGRSPAVGRMGHPAHRRRGFTRRAGSGGAFVRADRRDLRDRVLDRRPLHQQADHEGAGACVARSTGRRAESAHVGGGRGDEGKCGDGYMSPSPLPPLPQGEGKCCVPLLPRQGSDAKREGSGMRA